MFLKERLDKIIELVNKRGSITSQELMKILSVSESTIRRDISILASQKKIMRAHGGAISNDFELTNMKDSNTEDRIKINKTEKIRIAKYAAGLINDNDLVYIDAGTTTGYIIENITSFGAIFVTNSLSHAILLAKRRLNVYVIGGQVKSITDAIVNSEAIMSLSKYYFTKGFFGTNGISQEYGLTTPDMLEADVKRYAMSHCAMTYTLCDSHKFNKVSKVKFADLDSSIILTDMQPKDISSSNIIVV